MDVDWSELPPDLVDNIAGRLTIYVDYVRLRAVCWKWCSTLSPTPHQQLPCQFPWLMLSPESDLLLYGEHQGFYSLLENKVHRLNMANDLPWKRCCGSSHGWLVLLPERGPSILLYNPIARVQIHLPPITTFPNVLDFDNRKVDEEYLVHNPYGREPMKYSLAEMRDTFIKKVVLSTSPTSLDGDYIVVAIVDIGMQLAFCKKGDERWIIIEDSMDYEDVIYYEGVFYAVNHNRSFASFDVTDPSPSMKVIKLPTPVRCQAEKLYLVDSFGELLMVHRLFHCVDDFYHRFPISDTNGFEVLRLNSSRTEWVKVKSLGDRMLFLGTSSSLCLLATDFSGCDGNCIYFTGETKLGVFSLEDGSTKALPNCTSNRKTFLPPPVWLTPNPF